MLKPHLTYANLMATVAVFIALGGGAYALTLGRSDVKRKHIARNAVTSKKIAPNAVRGVDALESSFATVPNAAKLGGLGPGAFVSGNNSQQRLVVEAVPAGGDGVVHSLTGFGNVQYRNCAAVASGIGDIAYSNVSDEFQDIVDTTIVGGASPTMGYTGLPADSIVSPVFSLPANESPARLEIQVYSRGAPGRSLFVSIVATHDASPDPDVCRYSLWSSRIDEELG